MGGGQSAPKASGRAPSFIGPSHRVSDDGSGELPTFRKGRAVRVPAGALEKWIESGTPAQERSLNDLSGGRPFEELGAAIEPQRLT